MKGTTMKHIAALATIAVFCGSAHAIDVGTWNSIDDTVELGLWTEYYNGGAGQPGCEIEAVDVTDMQWEIDGLVIPDGGGPEVEWNGTVATYTTYYDSGLLELFDAAGLWGDGALFETVHAWVVAEVDYADPNNPVYLGGTMDGEGYYGDYTVMFYAEVMRTAEYDWGHEGTVDYLEVCVVPAPAVLTLLAAGLLARRRRR